MTHSIDTPPTANPPSTAELARSEAGNVGQTAADNAGQLASTASDQAANVAQEAKAQAQDVLAQGRDQLRQQAGASQQKAAEGLAGIAEQLRAMVEGNGTPSGPARDLVSQGADTVAQLADHLQNREPAQLLDDVRSFARRRPGAFLLGAAVAGVVAGRLTSGVRAAHSDTDSSSGAAHRSAGHSPARATYAGTDQAGGGFGYPAGTPVAPPVPSSAGTSVPPPPYGTVPPPDSLIPPTTPAGWDDPTRRPGPVS